MQLVDLTGWFDALDDEAFYAAVRSPEFGAISTRTRAYVAVMLCERRGVPSTRANSERLMVEMTGDPQGKRRAT